jgi:GAF domain-containing protein
MQSEREGNVTDTPREARVLDAVVSLVDNLLDDFDVVDLLTELTERCADLLDVSAAGLLLSDPLGELRLLAATSTQTWELELFQVQADEGPCVDCYATGEPVSVADLRTAVSRWPRFVPAALEAGVASVHAVPMRAAGIVLGSLGLFGSRTGELTESDLLVGQTLAHVACVAILQEHPPEPATVMTQLRSALTQHIVVEQAKGFLRERLDISVEEAFSLLRRYAHTHGEHLTDVARQLIADPNSRPGLLTRMRSSLKPEFVALGRAARRPPPGVPQPREV